MLDCLPTHTSILGNPEQINVNQWLTKMNIIKIPKKTKGKFREIAIPSFEEKIQFRQYISKLNEKTKKLCSDSVHGFVCGKSPVTNADQHRGKKYTLSFDLSDFFDMVKPSHLHGRLSKDEIQALMPDGRAYQGLPTSPAVANIAAIDMDKAIIKKIRDLDIVYTRYADDLTFSFDNFTNVGVLKKEITAIISRCGFRVNNTKTRLQDSRYGRRVVTGISVGESDISVTRKCRRKIRAAMHQKNQNSLNGLVEWSKLKIPKIKEPSKYSQKEVDELTTLWSIKKVDIRNIPQKEDTDLSDNVRISGDLIYLLGISNFTTNWKSCMHHPSGCNHKKVNAWAYLRGTRVGMLFSNDIMKVCSFERNKMKARTLIHRLRNGVEYYDRVYGESDESRKLLIQTLEENNIHSISKAPKDMKVEGNVPQSKVYKTPYLDSLGYKTGVASVGKFQGQKVYTFHTK